MNEETKPTTSPKAAVKPKTKSIDLVNPVEIPNLATPKPSDAIAKAATMTQEDWDKFQKDAKPIDITQSMDIPRLSNPDPNATTRPGYKEVEPTIHFAFAIIDSAKPEWLPTMMVRIANKCLAEKVFATPGAMAEAIVGASKK